MKQKAVIVDADGTLASVAWRRPLVEGPEKDWLQFHRLLSHDRPNPAVVATVAAHRANGHGIVLTSARPHWALRRTEFWLAEWGIEIDEVILRPARGPWRNDAEFKHRILHDLILPSWRIVCAYDDRDRVIEVWRSHGIPTEQVMDPGLCPRLESSTESLQLGSRVI